jgi:hypothetical protein
MTDTLVCWKCGASVEDLPLPLGRRDECLVCHAELHVCRMCRFYDVRVAKACREPMAEEVKDKERANFCDWFQPRPNAFQPREDKSQTAKSELDALFGGGPADRSDKSPRNELEDLFRQNPGAKE